MLVMGLVQRVYGKSVWSGSGNGYTQLLDWVTCLLDWLNCSCVPTVNDYRTHWTLRGAYRHGWVVAYRWTDGVSREAVNGWKAGLGD